MTPEQLDMLARSLRSGQYNLLLGAAASLGSINGDGKPLPLAGGLIEELANLKNTKPTHSLQRLYQTLDEDEISKHITNRFKNAKPGPTLKAIPTFMWRRIFTLNIDDALENAFKDGDAYQKLQTRNWKDPFEEFDDRSIVPLVHLHGDVSRPSDGYIFSRQAYLSLIKQINPWMHVLAELIATEPFIILGSSLDEVDLDYFLSMRSQTTARADRGPSILIEPFADAVTDRECERLGLLRFDGTGEEFLDFLNREVRDRPRPDDLIDEESRSVFVTPPSTLGLGPIKRIPSAIGL